MNTVNNGILNRAELTVIDLIESQAKERASKTVYEYLRDGEVVEESLTFAQLHEKARGLAVLIDQQCDRGDRVLLLFPSGLDYIVAFFATIYAGCIAVPAYPPQNQRRDWERLSGLILDSEPTLVLSPDDVSNSAQIKGWLKEQSLPHFTAQLPVDHKHTLLRELAIEWQYPEISLQTIAFLQYSSGSTGAPKGVMITHQNLLHNQYVIQNSSNRLGELRFVGWLPIYHDMGLIGNIIQPIYSGSKLTLMAPAHVIQKPFRWLKAISDKQAHVSGGPNFIYDLCVDKISEEQKRELDLSHWDVAFNGAEPVNAETMRRFADAFSSCGFRYSAFLPCYGLAENTLMVASTLFEQEPKVIEIHADDLKQTQARVVPVKQSDSAASLVTLVSSGNSIVGQTVKVVNPESLVECNDAQVGEVWVSGRSVAQGYWRQQNLSDKCFKQKIVSLSKSSPKDQKEYMRTGDLGFFREGHLFVTGRIKDVIIIRGQNHYPQDIEASVQSVSRDFRNSGTAAFSVDVHGQEKLIVVQELMPRSARRADDIFNSELRRSLRNIIAERHQLELYDFVAIKFGELSRTTSGKIQRFRNRERYIDSDFWAIFSSVTQLHNAEKNIAFIAPKGNTQKQIAALWAELLNLDKVSSSDNFFELGGHSLLLMQMIGRLNDLGFNVSAKDIFESSSLAELAHSLDTNRHLDSTSIIQYSEPQERIPEGCDHIQPNMLPLITLSDSNIRWIESQVLGGAKNIQDIYPLASLQEGILFHHTMNPKYDPYAIHRLFSADDESALISLIDSLSFVIKRHDALRTAILWKELDNPAQVVLRECDLSITRHCAESESLAADSAQVLCDSIGHSIDITQAPLLRLAVFANNENEKQYVVVQLHHIVVDNQCLAILERDMAAFHSGVQASLPLTPAYRSFIAFNRHQAKYQDQANQFFTHSLGDIEQPTLPLGLVDIANHGLDLSNSRVELDAQQSEQIRQAAKQLKVSPATIFHAAWAMVVSAYSDRDDVVFGTVLSGRLQGVKGAEQMLGAFINTLPVRINLNRDTNTALIQLHRQLCELVSFEQYPLVSAQSCSQIGTDSTLFSAVLNYRHSGLSVTERKQALANSGIQFLKLNERTNYPFTLCVDDFDSGFDLLVQIDRSDQGCDVLQCMLNALKEITDTVVLEHSRKLCNLDVLSEANFEEQFGRYLETNQAFEKKCIHELFEQHAKANPDHTALIFDDKELSYVELNQRANQLAHNLIETHQVHVDELIGLCIDRSFEMFIALLAILKAGGAYVPLDPESPPERLKAILGDSGVNLVVTNIRTLDKLTLENCRAIVLDDENTANKITEFDVDNIDTASRGLTWRNLAYAIYTSGSTGIPKGVLLEHRGLSNLTSVHQQTLAITPQSRVLQFASIAFDAATWEWCMALTNGASLVLAEQTMIKSPEHLSNYVQQQKVTHATLPPALLPSLNLDCWEGVKTLIVAGDHCALKDARRWAQNRTFINAYGPSETTICATMGQFQPSMTALNIGFPLANTHTYILNQHLMPVPKGGIGELYIGGVGLARCYLNRDKLNENFFIDNPFYNAGCLHSSPRLYKTGDLVRCINDGNIEFIGRVDHQIKIRGFRVELGEIENTIVEQSSVSEAVVIADRLSVDDTRLYGYVVADFSVLKTPELQKELALKQVNDWADTFDNSYQQSDSIKSFVIDGWNSSYTRSPMPIQEMEEWLACTIKRIKSLNPRSVLEIGCGAGLILKDIAPISTRYVGTDLSQNTVNNLGAAIDAHDLKHCDITLLQGDAKDFNPKQSSILANVTFDTVIINSVAQYFPNIDYFSEVIENVIRAMKPGGKLFIGDIRHLELLEVFHSSVLRFQSKSSMSTYEFDNQVQNKLDREHELAVSPLWFYDLVSQINAVESVDVLPKIENVNNELSAFRYDVIITLAGKPGIALDLEVDWTECDSNYSIEILEEMLEYHNSSAVGGWVKGFKSITNPRVNEEAHFLENTRASLRTNGAKVTLGLIESQNRLDITPRQVTAGISPADLQNLCDKHGYLLSLSWLPLSNSSPNDGRYNALISKMEFPFHYDWGRLITEPATEYERANNPIKASFLEYLPRTIKESIATKLPKYMVPSTITLLSSLPLNINGKIDRKLLASIDSGGMQGSYQKPENESQRTMCAIWQDVLLIKRVGIYDSFFELGGHSLLATRLVAQINQRFGVQFPLKSVFDTKNLDEMTNLLRSLDNQGKASPIVAVTRDQILPLSFAQQRLWLLDQIDEGSRHYLMPGAFRLSGPLTVNALSKAFRHVFERHESLRTCFVVDENGEPQQVVCQAGSFELGSVDLSLLSTVQQTNKLHSLLFEESARSFDLASDLMLRATVFKLANDEHVLHVVMHHIAADGWSLPILLNELSVHYQSSLENSDQARLNELSSPTIQYADYAVWQRKTLQGEELSQHLEYWRRQLKGLPVVHSLPLDFTRPASQTFNGANHQSHLNIDLSNCLKALCKSENATLFMGLHALFSVLLARYSNDTDIVIGTPVANREQAEVSGLIGFFVNMIVLRSDLSGNPSFRELLSQSKSLLSHSYTHQQLPFEQLVDAVQPQRSLSHSPLFQVMLNLLSPEESTRPTLAGLKVEPLNIEHQVAKYDLSLNVQEVGEEPSLVWEYNTDLFRASTIARLAECFDNLVVSILKQPTADVYRAVIVSQDENKLSIDSVNDTYQEMPDLDIEALFSQQAAIRGDKIAARFDQETLSYTELEIRSNQLAYVLQTRGVGPNTLVGIAQTRSLSLLVSVLAVMKAGAAYVPIDPSYPKDRIRFMLNDAGMSVMLADQTVIDSELLELSQNTCQILNVNEPETFSEECNLPPKNGALATDLAYVIYTSGSTGTPKGVEVTRSNLSNFILSMKSLLGTDEQDRLLAVTSLSFDIAALELYLPLVCGAEVIIADEALSMDGKRLQWALNDNPDAAITMMQATPVTWKLLLATGWQYEHLRKFTALCGGEAFPVELAKKLTELPIQVWNLYGPTETTVWSAAYDVSKRADDIGNSVPIGTPISNTELHILDKHRNSLPVGAIGELYIGGSGVTRGYLGQ
ncbi:MAG: amino acid adenylation domain-containing protein, partial [Arenicella sp.]|nr:amino acid adenylation domain-containing protein [Arenicella sp.]